MPAITGRAVLSIVSKAAQLLDVALPAEVTDALTKAENLTSTAENISGAGLVGAVLDAIEAGRDFRTDKHVAAASLSHVLVSAGLTNAARERSSALIEAAIVEHADTILGVWSDALEPHSAALVSAADVLPDLDDIATVKALGGEAMNLWGPAQHGVRVWTATADAFRMIATAARITVSKDNPLILTAANFSALADAETDARTNGTPITAWMLACHHIPLSLPDLGGFMERSAVYQQQRTTAAAEAQQRNAQAERAALTT